MEKVLASKKVVRKSVGKAQGKAACAVKDAVEVVKDCPRIQRKLGRGILLS